jgi:nucleotide-binding universal stress UspA family protein
VPVLREGRLSVDKLNSVLAVAERADEIVTVLEKSTAIASAFGARVEFLVAGAEMARATAACNALRECPEVSLCSLHRGTESLSDIILRRVLDTEPDLVVKAPAGAHPLRRWTLDDNDWYLASACPVPLLLARPQRWGAPVSLAAAVDVAEESQEDLVEAILQGACCLALAVHGELAILYSELEQTDQRLRMERTVRLARLVRERHLGCDRILRFEGPPQQSLPAHASERRYDVLVVGARTRRETNEDFIPRTTCRLVEATLGDVLIVKQPIRAAAISGRQRSLREQGADQIQEFA